MIENQTLQELDVAACDVADEPSTPGLNVPVWPSSGRNGAGNGYGAASRSTAQPAAPAAKVADVQEVSVETSAVS